MTIQPCETDLDIANYGLAVIVALINYGIGRAAEAHPGGLAAWKGMSLFLGEFQSGT